MQEKGVAHYSISIKLVRTFTIASSSTRSSYFHADLIHPMFKYIHRLLSSKAVKTAPFTPTSHMGAWRPALLVSGVDRAAQPGAMGAPSYVQPDHWDQAEHQLFHSKSGACGPTGLCQSAPLPLPANTVLRFKPHPKGSHMI